MEKEKFIGKRQWTVFFLSLAGVWLLSVLILALVGMNFFWTMIVPTIIALVISILALLKGYLFFANNPRALNIKGQSYVSVPHNHVAIVLENGEYNGFLEPGYYFVFPFFITFYETVFLGIVEEKVFEEGNKVEFKEGVSAPVKAVYNFKVVDIKKYAFEELADVNVRNIIASLVRTALGDLTIRQAREGKYNSSEAITEDFFTHIKNEDPEKFGQILSKYGLEIIAINIIDIELAEEELALNRQRHQAKIAKDIANDKAEEMETLARAEAKVLELRGGGLFKQVESLANANCNPDTILAYLAENKKWDSLKDTDKTFIIDNGKSVMGMLAALKGLESGSGNV